MGLSLLADIETDVRLPASREEVVLTLAEALKIEPTGAPRVSFSDVDEASPFAAVIYTLAERNIVRGDTDESGNPIGRFRPKDPVIRAEVAVIAWRLIQGAFTTIRASERPAMHQMEWTCSSDAAMSPLQAGVDLEPALASTEGPLYVVTAYALNLRMRPDITAPRHATLSAGTVVTVLDTIADTWAHIRLSDGAEGYVGLSGLAQQ